MSKLDKARTRLLVISRDAKVCSDLVILLTGYGYFVDYVQNREDGIERFRQHKHAVVIMDVPALPQFPEEVFRAFYVYRRNPIILIAAHRHEQERMVPYLDKGVFDIIELPLKIEFLHFRLRRLVAHSELQSRKEFLQTLVAMGLILLPVWFLVVYMLARG